MKALVVIPARGGSKGIPLKNIQLFNKRPLIFWSIKSAVEWEYATSVVVATDCDQIENYVISLQLPKVSIYRQSPEQAADTVHADGTSQKIAMTHHDCEVVMQREPTNPLAQPDDFTRSLQLLQTGNYDSVISGYYRHLFIWRNDPASARSFNYDYTTRPRRQDWKGEFVEDSNIYMTRQNALLKTGLRISGRIGLYEMPITKALNIDYIEDIT